MATKYTVYLFHSFCRLLIIKLLNENSKSLTALFNQVHIIHLVGVVLCVLLHRAGSSPLKSDGKEWTELCCSMLKAT